MLLINYQCAIVLDLSFVVMNSFFVSRILVIIYFLITLLGAYSEETGILQNNVVNKTGSVADTVNNNNTDAHPTGTNIKTYLEHNKPAIFRALIVVASVSGIVLVYLFVRCLR